MSPAGRTLSQRPYYTKPIKSAIRCTPNEATVRDHGRTVSLCFGSNFRRELCNLKICTVVRLCCKVEKKVDADVCSVLVVCDPALPRTDARQPEREGLLGGAPMSSG